MEDGVRRRLLRQGILGLAVALFASLSPVRSDALAVERIRVAVSTKDFGYLPLFVGVRANYFRDEELEIQWLQVKSNVVITALMGGELDVAASAGAAMRAAARGAPLRAIFFPYYKCTFVLMSSPDIKKVQDLKGKVIGTNSAGSAAEIAASIVLEHNGVNSKRDVTFFSTGGADTSVLAMQQGVIKAIAINPDAAFLLRKKGFTVLASLADYGPWPWGGYATSVSKLSQERDKVKRWTRAMVKSLLFMVNKREDTIRIAQAEFGYPRDVIESALNVSLKAIDPRDPGGADDASLRSNIDLTMVQPMQLKEPPPLARLVDFSPLREVQAELGIKSR